MVGRYRTLVFGCCLRVPVSRFDMDWQMANIGIATDTPYLILGSRIFCDRVAALDSRLDIGYRLLCSRRYCSLSGDGDLWMDDDRCEQRVHSVGLDNASFSENTREEKYSVECELSPSSNPSPR